MGVVGLAAAFILGSLDQLTFPTFLGDAFLNLGSGFIGAAVTFVLFQVLLTGRGVNPEHLQQLEQRIAELKETIEKRVPARDSSTLMLRNRRGRGSRHRRS
jgi:hypothetical protein